MAGIGSDAIRFFEELEADNTREFWARNADRYREVVREPFLRLLDGVGPLDAPWRVYRPHNDVRFRTGGAPYKTFIGAVTQRAGGNGHFVQISRRGLLVASGYPMMAPDQLARFRAAVAAEPGEAFARAVERSRADGREVTGGRWEPLRRAPRGYPNDHPRVEWLRAKGVELPQRLGSPRWLATTTAGRRVREALDAGGEVVEWLDRHVGPSSMSPEEIWGR